MTKGSTTLGCYYAEKLPQNRSLTLHGRSSSSELRQAGAFSSLISSSSVPLHTGTAEAECRKTNADRQHKDEDSREFPADQQELRVVVVVRTLLGTPKSHSRAPGFRFQFCPFGDSY